MYFLAYVGSKRVKDLPLHFVAPVMVMKTKRKPKAAVARPKARRVSTTNYYSGRFRRIYSITT